MDGRISFLALLVLAGAIAVSMPARAADRCKVTDPTGAPLNLRDAEGRIIGMVVNGRDVCVHRYSEDDQARPWVYVKTANGKPPGWAYREFISCYRGDATPRPRPARAAFRQTALRVPAR